MRRFPAVAALRPVLAALVLPLAGCSALQTTDSFLGVITPYRIDIVQGNVVTEELIAQVKPGQSRAQVRDLLGTPLLTDPFHADRWDYLFSIRRPGTEPQRRAIVIRFEQDRVASVEAPDLPGEREFVASISRQRNLKLPKLELSEDERAALKPPPRLEAAPAVPGPTGAARSYPPLEAAP